MKKVTIKKFFEERPAINKKKFIAEVGFSAHHLRKVLNDKAEITTKFSRAILPVMEKYGLFKDNQI